MRLWGIPLKEWKLIAGRKWTELLLSRIKFLSTLRNLVLSYVEKLCNFVTLKISDNGKWIGCQWETSRINIILEDHESISIDILFVIKIKN